MRRWFWFVVLVAVCAACGSGGSTTEGDAASVADEPAVVAAAAARRMGSDNGMGGTAYRFELVNVVRFYGVPDRNGFLKTTSVSPEIAAAVRTAVERALAPSRVVWVDSQASVIGRGPTLPTSREVGAVLTLAAPDIDGSTARITTGMWCGGTCGTGGRFVLRKTAGVWSVTGTEGASWIA